EKQQARWLKDGWIEVFPFGVAFGVDRSRPVVLFKDEKEERTFPVWSNHMDAGIALFQDRAPAASASPHALTWKILEPLGVKLESCLFTEVRGHHQYMELKFSGHPKLKSIHQRSDEALSFVLAAQTRFYCRPEFIEQS